MLRYLLPLTLVAGCAAAPEPEPVPTRSDLYDGFVGQPFAWTHVSGVSGETVHYPGGTMVYDSNDRERIALYTLSPDDRYCMNSGDYDQVCFTLVETPTGYASGDGTFTYDRIEAVVPPPPPPPVPTTPPAGSRGAGPSQGVAPPDFAASIYDTPIYSGQRFGASSDTGAE